MKNWFTSLLAAAGLLATTVVNAQNVGIGTTAPTQKLDVNGGLRVRDLTGSDKRLVQTNADGTLTSSSNLPSVTVLTTPPNLGSVAVASLRGVAVSGNYLYVTQRTTPNQIKVYDISNPTVLTAVGTPVTGGTGLDLLAVSGNYIYVCDITADQIRVYTTTGAGTVITPSLVRTIATADQPNGVAVVGNFMYVACYGTNTIERYSVTTPDFPVFEASMAAGSQVAGLVAYNGYLYAANYGAATLETFSINATTGVLTSTNVQTVGTQPNAVAVANNLLYLTNSGNNTLQLFNLSNPAAPVSQNTVPTGGRPYGFAVKGNYAYISNNTSGTIEVRQLSQNNALGFDSDGNISSIASSTLGDDLGDHTATTNLNLNGNYLVGGTLGTPGTSGIFVSPIGLTGIGTLTPTSKLEIIGGNNATGNLANSPVALSFGYSGTGNGYRHYVRTRHNSTVTAGGNAIDFYLNSDATATNSTAPGTGNIPVLTMESNNALPRVGIGTTSPAAALDVNGTVQLGINGTTFAALVRAAVNLNVTSVPANSTLDVDFSTGTGVNLASGATVAVSPQVDLPAGLGIVSARVKTATAGAGVITVRFMNTTAAAIDPAAVNYYFTVFQ